MNSKILMMVSYCPRTDSAVDQSDQELLIFTVSDEELEKAANVTTWAQTYPQTCSRTICLGT
jgi:hypothetical protein